MREEGSSHLHCGRQVMLAHGVALDFGGEDGLLIAGLLGGCGLVQWLISMTGGFGLFVGRNYGSVSRGLALFWFGHDVLCLGIIEYKNVEV